MTEIVIRLSAVLLVTLVYAAPLCQGAKDEEGFVSLFDGKTLQGWTLDGAEGNGFVVEEGTLVCPQGSVGNLYTTHEYANFVLRLQYRMSAGGNNGVAIRAPGHGRASSVGMEIQIIDNDHPMWKRLRPEQLDGSIYDVVAAQPGHNRGPGQWNDLEIAADKRQVTVRLNGAVILDSDLNSITDPKVLEKHPGLRRPSGLIGLLGHETRVEFRAVRVKRLP
ncbi:MAG: DUF1080 domain-containing protein [Bryobacteraceae bacterium]